MQKSVIDEFTQEDNGKSLYLYDGNNNKQTNTQFFSSVQTSLDANTTSQFLSALNLNIANANTDTVATSITTGNLLVTYSANFKLASTSTSLSGGAQGQVNIGDIYFLRNNAGMTYMTALVNDTPSVLLLSADNTGSIKLQNTLNNAGINFIVDNTGLYLNAGGSVSSIASNQIAITPPGTSGGINLYGPTSIKLNGTSPNRFAVQNNNGTATYLYIDSNLTTFNTDSFTIKDASGSNTLFSNNLTNGTNINTNDFYINNINGTTNYLTLDPNVGTSINTNLYANNILYTHEIRTTPTYSSVDIQSPLIAYQIATFGSDVVVNQTSKITTSNLISNSGSISMNNCKLTNLIDPSIGDPHDAQTAATRHYVDVSVADALTGQLVSIDQLYVRVSGSIMSGTLKIDQLSPTNSTSTTTGSFVTNGGVGIGGNINIGGTANITGSTTLQGITTISNNTPSTNTSTGCLLLAGGIGMTGNIYTSGIINITNSTTTNGTNTGALIVNGGIYSGNNIMNSGYISTKNILIQNSITNTSDKYGTFFQGKPTQFTDNTSTTTIPFASEFGFSGTTIYTSNNLTITNAATVYIDSPPSAGAGTTITNPYSLYINTGNTLTNGNLYINSSTTSSNSTNGALTVLGGVGISGPTNFGNTVNISNTLTLSGQLIASQPSTFNNTVTINNTLSLGGYSITNLANPTNDQDAATKYYVTSMTGNYLPLTGGTLTGTLVVNSGITASTGITINTGNLTISTGNSVISSGNLSVNSITSTNTLGNLSLSYITGDTTNSYISNVNMFNTTDYAIKQNNSGATTINSKSGQSLNLSIANTQVAYINSSGLNIPTGYTLNLIGTSGITSAGTITSNGLLTVNNNMTVDSTTLCVNTTNHNVGIGTSSPTNGYIIDIRGSMFISGAIVSTGTITTTSTISATSFSGKIITGFQDQITDVGNLNNLTVIGSTTTNRLLTSGNISLAPSSTIGLAINQGSFEYTNNSSPSNTVVPFYATNFLSGTVIKATSTNITTTSASTLYISGSPTAGTNQTLTKSYALNINSGITLLNDTTTSSAYTNGSLIVSGGVGIAGALNVNGNISSNANVTCSNLTLSGSLTIGTINGLSNNLVLTSPTTNNNLSVTIQGNGTGVGNLTVTGLTTAQNGVTIPNTFGITTNLINGLSNSLVMTSPTTNNNLSVTIQGNGTGVGNLTVTGLTTAQSGITIPNTFGITTNLINGLSNSLVMTSPTTNNNLSVTIQGNGTGVGNLTVTGLTTAQSGITVPNTFGITTSLINGLSNNLVITSPTTNNNLTMTIQGNGTGVGNLTVTGNFTVNSSSTFNSNVVLGTAPSSNGDGLLNIVSSGAGLTIVKSSTGANKFRFDVSTGHLLTIGQSNTDNAAVLTIARYGTINTNISNVNIYSDNVTMSGNLAVGNIISTTLTSSILTTSSESTTSNNYINMNEGTSGANKFIKFNSTLSTNIGTVYTNTNNTNVYYSYVNSSGNYVIAQNVNANSLTISNILSLSPTSLTISNNFISNGTITSSGLISANAGVTVSTGQYLKLDTINTLGESTITNNYIQFSPITTSAHKYIKFISNASTNVGVVMTNSSDTNTIHYYLNASSSGLLTLNTSASDTTLSPTSVLTVDSSGNMTLNNINVGGTLKYGLFTSVTDNTGNNYISMSPTTTSSHKYLKFASNSSTFTGVVYHNLSSSDYVYTNLNSSGLFGIYWNNNSSSTFAANLMTLSRTGVMTLINQLNANDIVVAGDKTLTINAGTNQGGIVVSSSKASTSYTSGALIVSGGVGIGGDLNVNGQANVTGNVSVTGSLTVLGPTIVNSVTAVTGYVYDNNFSFTNTGSEQKSVTIPYTKISGFIYIKLFVKLYGTTTTGTLIHEYEYTGSVTFNSSNATVQTESIIDSSGTLGSVTIIPQVIPTSATAGNLVIQMKPINTGGASLPCSVFIKILTNYLSTSSINFSSGSISTTSTTFTNVNNTGMIYNYMGKTKINSLSVPTVEMDIAGSSLISGTLGVSGLLTASGGITTSGNISQTGATTVSTGTGAITLNGDTTLVSKTLFFQNAGNFTTGIISSSSTAANYNMVLPVSQSYGYMMCDGASPGILSFQNTGMKAFVNLATTANVALTTVTSIDGVTLTTGMRVLVKDQTVNSQNGIYVFSGTLNNRATDFNNTIDGSNPLIVYVRSGTTNFSTMWAITNTGSVTIGTTNITISQLNSKMQGAFVANNTATFNNTVTLTGALSTSSNITQTGTTTFSTGTGSVTLNGPTNILNTLSVGGVTTFTSKVIVNANLETNDIIVNSLNKITSTGDLNILTNALSDVLINSGTNTVIFGGTTTSTLTTPASNLLLTSTGSSGIVTITSPSGTLNVESSTTATPTISTTNTNGLTITGTSVTISTTTSNLLLAPVGSVTTNANFSQTGAKTFSTGTGSVSLNGATSIGSTLSVTGASTMTGVINANGGILIPLSKTISTTSGNLALSSASSIQLTPSSNIIFFGSGGTATPTLTTAGTSMTISATGTAATTTISSTSGTLNISATNGATANTVTSSSTGGLTLSSTGGALTLSSVGTLALSTTGANNITLTTGTGSVTTSNNFSQSGATTFSTGTGAVSLNGQATANGGIVIPSTQSLTSSGGALTITSASNNIILTPANGTINVGSTITTNGTTLTLSATGAAATTTISSTSGKLNISATSVATATTITSASTNGLTLSTTGGNMTISSSGSLTLASTGTTLSSKITHTPSAISTTFSNDTHGIFGNFSTGILTVTTSASPYNSSYYAFNPSSSNITTNASLGTSSVVYIGPNPTITSGTGTLTSNYSLFTAGSIYSGGDITINGNISASGFVNASSGIVVPSTQTITSSGGGLTITSASTYGITINPSNGVLTISGPTPTITNTTGLNILSTDIGSSTTITSGTGTLNIAASSNTTANTITSSSTGGLTLSSTGGSLTLSATGASATTTITSLSGTLYIAAANISTQTSIISNSTNGLSLSSSNGSLTLSATGASATTNISSTSGTLNISATSGATANTITSSSTGGLTLSSTGGTLTLSTGGSNNLTLTAGTSGSITTGSNFSQTGSKTFSTGTGNISLNGIFTHTIPSTSLNISANTYGISGSFSGNTFTNTNASSTASNVSFYSFNSSGSTITSAQNITGIASVVYIGANPTIGAGTLGGSYSLVTNGDVFISSSTNSSSTLTGSLRIAGGIGLSGNLYLAGNIVQSGAGSMATGTGGFTANGAVSLNGNVTIGSTNTLTITSSGTTDFAQLTTGSLSVGQYINIGTRTLRESAASAFDRSAITIGQPSFTATSGSAVVTNASTFYISNAPSASSGITITNSYAVYVANGQNYFNHGTIIGSASSKYCGSSYIAPTYVGLSTAPVSVSTAATVFIDNAPGVGSFMTIGNSYALMINSGPSLFNHGTISVASNGTYYGTTFSRPTYASVSAVTVTNPATVYIENSPQAGTGVTLSGAYSLYVAAGQSFFGGNVSISGTNTLTVGGAITVNGLASFNGGIIFPGAIIADGGITTTNSLPISSTGTGTNITLSTSSNGNIVLSPNGTGNVSINNTLSLGGNNITQSGTGSITTGTGGITSNGTLTVSNITSANAITISSTGTGTGITLSTSSNGNISLNPNGTGVVSIGNGLSLSTNNMTLSGNISQSGAGFITTGSGGLTVNGTLIVSGSITTANALSLVTSAGNNNITLTPNGTGTIILSKATTISAGGLSVTGNVTQSGTGSITTGSGGLILGGTLAVGTNNMTISGNITQSSTGSITTGSGGLILGGTLVVGTNNMTISGNITQSSTGSITTGSGAITLNGDTTVANKILYLNNGTASIGLKAPTTISAAYTWSLPAADSYGYVYSNGGGIMSMQNNGLKRYVDAASTANVNISNPGTTSIDGVTLSSGSRVLLKDQTTGSENGIYVFATSTTAMTRSPDYNDTTDSPNPVVVYVRYGSTNIGTMWTISTTGTITINTTSISFAQINTRYINTIVADGGITTANALSVASSGSTLTLSSGSASNITLSPGTTGIISVGGLSPTINGTLSLLLSTTVGGITINPSGLITLSKATTISTGGLTVTAGGITITSGTLAVGANAITSTGTMSVGAITTNGNFSQTGTTTFSTGSGAVSLNGATTIATGGLTITSGTLAVGANAITSTGTMSVGAITTNGNFSQTGVTTFSTGSGAVSLNGATTIATGGLTITSGTLAVGANAITSTGTMSVGAITTNGNFSQTGVTTFSTGSGAVSLNGATTIATGGLTITSGTLAVGANAITSTGTMSVGAITTNGNFSQTGVTTFSTGSGAITLNGATTISNTNTLSVGGATTITGLLTANGGITMGGGTLAVGANNMTISGNITQSSTGSITTGSNGLTANGVITANGGITTANALTIASTGTNTGITLSPNGTGTVTIGGTLPTITTATNTSLALIPNGTGTLIIGGTTPTITTLTSSNSDIKITSDGTGSVILSKATKISGANISYTQLASNSLTTGFCFNMDARTLVESIGPTSFSRSAFAIGQPTFLSSAGTAVISTASTLYIDNAPTFSTGYSSITNPYALYINAGSSLFGGSIQANGGIVVSSTQNITSSGGALTLTSAATNGITINPASGTLTIGGTGSQTITTPSGINMTLTTGGTGTMTITTGGTGTITMSKSVTMTGNVSQTGTGTFSTGTGAISLNGDTTIVNKVLYLQNSAPANVGLKAPATITAAYTWSLPPADGYGLVYSDGSGNLSVQNNAMKAYVVAASTANITISTPGFTTLDGVTLTSGSRILLKDQNTASQNGIFVYTDSVTALVRATDFNTASDAAQPVVVYVTGGNINGYTAWALATSGVTFGTTSLTFIQLNSKMVSQIIANGGITTSTNTNLTITTGGTGTLTLTTGGAGTITLSKATTLSNGLTISAGGISVTSGSLNMGSNSITGVTTLSTSSTITSGGTLTISTGGLTVTAGGISVTSGSLNMGSNSITGVTTLSTSSTITSGGALTISTGGLTVTAGGISVTSGSLNMGSNSITGVTTLSTSGTITSGGALTVSTGNLTVTAGTAIIDKGTLGLVTSGVTTSFYIGNTSTFTTSGYALLQDNTGNTTINAASTKTLAFAVGGSTVVSIAGTTMTMSGSLAMGANAITSTGTLNVGAITTSGTLDLNLNAIVNVSTIVTTSTVTSGGALVVSSGGLTVTAGGLTVSAGGLIVTAGGASITTGTLVVDKGKMGLVASGVATSFYLSNSATFTTTGYALLQDNTGNTTINAASGKALAFAINGSNIVSISGTTMTMSGSLAMGSNAITSTGTLSIGAITTSGTLNMNTNSITGITTLSTSGTITSGGALTVSAGGLTVTAGGLTITSGNLAVSSGTLTVSSTSSLGGNVSITGTGTLTVAGLITASSGVRIASGQTLTSTGALALTSASATNITLTPGSGGAISLASNTSVTGTFSVSSTSTFTGAITTGDIFMGATNVLSVAPSGTQTIVNPSLQAGSYISIGARTCNESTSSPNDRTGISIGRPTFTGGGTATQIGIATTFYIDNAPTFGTGYTGITNPYALYVNAGSTYFGGNIVAGQSTTLSMLSGGTASGITPSFSSGSYINIGAKTLSETTASTTDRSAITIGKPTFSGGGTATTVSNASTVYIDGAPINGTGITITNPYALYVNSGNSYLSGNLTIGGTTVTVSSPYALRVNTGDTYMGGNLTVTSGGSFTMTDNFGLAITTSSISTGLVMHVGKRLISDTVGVTSNRSGTVITAPSYTVGVSVPFTTVPIATTLYIDNAPSYINTLMAINNPYALYIEAGASYFGQGTINVVSTTPTFLGTTFMAPIFTAASAMTAASASTVYIDGPPTGSNVTITNAFSLRVNSGNTSLGGNLNVSGTTTLATTSIANLTIFSTNTFRIASTSSTATNITSPTLTTGSVLSVGTRTCNESTASTSNRSLFTIGQPTYTATTGTTTIGIASTLYIDNQPTTGTGYNGITNPYALYVNAGGSMFNHGTMTVISTGSYYGMTLNRPTFTSTSAITIANAATLYIDNAPTNAGSATITNPYALYVNSGESSFGGPVQITPNSTGTLLIGSATSVGDGIVEVDVATTAASFLTLCSSVTKLRVAASSDTMYIQAGSSASDTVNSNIKLCRYNTTNVPLKSFYADCDKTTLTGSLEFVVGANTNISNIATGISNGAYVRIPARTLDETTASTNNRSAFSIGIPTFSGGGTGQVVPIASTFYIDNAPSSGANIGITNPYALHVGAGACIFSHNVLYIRTAGSYNGTTFGSPIYFAGSAMTITNAATVYIDNAPTVSLSGFATITNAYALLVNAGTSGFGGNIQPTTNNTVSCGTSTNKWTAVYATNGTIQTSDIRLKDDVDIINQKLSNDFIKKINQVSYKWKDVKDGKYNLGVIAQNIISVQNEMNFCKDSIVSVDDNGYYSVSYAELIPLIIGSNKELNKIVSEQGNKIDEMNNVINIVTESLDSYKNSNEELNRIVSEQGNKIDEMNNVIKSVTESLDSYKNSNEELNRIVSEQGKKINDMNNVINSQETQIQNMSKMIETLTKNMEMLMKNITV